jgi:predicted AlkP superfamily phosphohydrolase/phosphomutase
MAQTSQLLLIGLDAADPVLIEQWMDEGILPNLAMLKKAGTYGHLATSARHLAGSPWPSFYTGLPPSHHGIYHDFQWYHERMEFSRPTYDWLPVSPFWRHMNSDVAVIAYDVPMVPHCTAFGGFEISGWASHDKLGPPDSYPPQLINEIENRFGRWPISAEEYGPSSIDNLLELRQHLLENTRRSARLALWLLRRPWNLAIVVFSALHRGGHRLWDRSSVKGTIPKNRGAVFDHALQDLYIASDNAVGELIAAAPGATVIVFSLHGMRANTSRVDLLDEMIGRVLRDKEYAPRRAGLFRRIGETLPLEWRRAMTKRVPTRFQNRLMTMWTTGGIDWEKTEAFTLRADLQGYIRINLKGREPEGIVSPGSSYEQLCNAITDGLLTFYDVSTGQPIVDKVCRIDRLYEDGTRRDKLPDLIVLWKDTPATMHTAVESPNYGRIEWKTPGRMPNGRSGNHRPEGFILAHGKSIAASARLEKTANILDIAPTVVHLLGARTSLALAGKLIPELTEDL